MDGADEGALRDAMMITAAQKVEHYEIASYGTVRTYASLLGEKGVARLLDETLKQEKAADKKLTTIAAGTVNKRAAKEWQEQSSAAETATGMLEKGANWVGATVGGAMKAIRPNQAADRKRKGAGGRSKKGAR
jgi:hypothetical protein